MEYLIVILYYLEAKTAMNFLSFSNHMFCQIEFKRSCKLDKNGILDSKFCIFLEVLSFKFGYHCTKGCQ